MTHPDAITLYHAPNTRSAGAQILLEELGAPHTLHVLNAKAGENRQPPYLSVNPLGKVPAIHHHGALVTEQVAIFIYLADLFPEAGLAPAITDPQRGPYLRWLVLYAACYEPALIDRALKREPGPLAMSPYGSFDAVLDTITTALASSPYLLGAHVCAADVLWGTALRWGFDFGLVPPNPTLQAFVARMAERPAFRKVAEDDARLAAAQAAAAGSNA
jgi:glutathione S-transferase